MVGKGQPPKKPEDRRDISGIRFSPKEREKIEEACKIRNRKFSAFVRESAIEKAEQVIEESK